jgi:hypothetical protein
VSQPTTTLTTTPTTTKGQQNMSNTDRSEHNRAAWRETMRSDITGVSFHGNNGKMIQADWLKDAEGHDHIALHVGRATFFLEGDTANEKIVQMQLIGLAIVAASEELLKNGPT